MSTNNYLSLLSSFPILKEKVNGKPLIYFDNAATTQKPEVVIDSLTQYYQTSNANVHRAAHHLSSKATLLFEQSREKVMSFINASNSKEVIWTKGTTESINLVASTWGEQHISSGDEIILSHAEHHANIVPWQQLAVRKGAIIKVAQLDAQGRIDVEHFKSLLSSKTQLVSLHHISNVIGKVNHIEHFIKLAKTVGACVLVDAAQSIANFPVDVQQLNCDFLVFSAHKMYGPTGLGVLYGKKDLLEAMPPYQTGGEMIKKVSFVSETTFNELPYKFEAGTPNIAAVIAFIKAIDFIIAHKLNQPSQKKNELVNYCYQQLSAVTKLTFVVDEQPDIAIFSFNIEGIHPQDLGSYLDANGVAVRVGHHCAMPLMESLKQSGCIRISLAAYNTKQEVDQVVTLIRTFDENTEQYEISNEENLKNNAVEELVQKFSLVKGWDAKHRQIMLLGKIKSTDTAIRIDSNLVQGCESKAWLKLESDKDGQFIINADSDAKIIRGLLYIVKLAFNGKTAEQINRFDIDDYFEQLGLIQHLSPSRGNGLLAIVKAIKEKVTT